MTKLNDLRKLVNADEAADDLVQNRCLESAANIVRNYTGRMIIPDQLNGAVFRIAELLYQRRLSCCDMGIGDRMKNCPRDIARLLDEWRLEKTDS